jgi:hypothetical protein
MGFIFIASIEFAAMAHHCLWQWQHTPNATSNVKCPYTFPAGYIFLTSFVVGRSEKKIKDLISMAVVHDEPSYYVTCVFTVRATTLLGVLTVIQYADYYDYMIHLSAHSFHV